MPSAYYRYLLLTSVPLRCQIFYRRIDPIVHGLGRIAQEEAGETRHDTKGDRDEVDDAQ